MLANKVFVLFAICVAVAVAFPALEEDDQPDTIRTNDRSYESADVLVNGLCDHKINTQFIFVIVFVSYCIDGDGELTDGIVAEHARSKRATCDLLSPFKVGHAACAANCLRLGFRGGYCNDRAVCNCRKWMDWNEI